MACGVCGIWHWRPCTWRIQDAIRSSVGPLFSYGRSIAIPVMASKMTGHAEAKADINSVDGCLSFSGSISIQFTG